jgi:hypothetical protein
VLPHNEDRPQASPVPNLDLTQVHGPQYNTFICTFRCPSPANQEPHETTLSEAKELTDLFSNTTISAASVVDSIIEIRLVMRKAGYNNEKPRL